MIICNNCSRENEDEFKFCLGCGSALTRPAPPAPEPAATQVVKCPHCGTELPGQFKFCGACGGAIPDPAAALSPVAASVPPRESSPAPVVQAEPVAPVMPREEEAVGTLTVIRPDGSEGATLKLTRSEMILGRDSRQDTLANDPFLSPQHAALEYDGDGFKIRDLGSLNGVFLRVRREAELQDGDDVRIGQELLRFEHISSVKSYVEPPADSQTKVGGSPAEKVWGRLSVVSGPDLVSKAFALQADDVVIGREIGTIVFRDDGFVSGKHARLSRANGRVVLEDLGSSNGTYLRIRKEQKVKNGDLILMGQQLFRLEM